MAIDLKNISRQTHIPRCPVHNKPLFYNVACIYDPIATPRCEDCDKDFEQPIPPTRWPNAGDPGGAEL